MVTYDLNPYRGGNWLREFAYDARHPSRFVKSCVLRKDNPRVNGLTRFAGIGCMVFGLANVVTGIVMVVR